MRRLMVAVLGLAALAAGCATLSGSEVREVLVDYLDDEVASSFLLYFPSDVTMRPGDTVVFKQRWTGEPHSVTMGTLVDEAIDVVGPLLDEYGEAEEEPPEDVMAAYEAAMAPLPDMMDNDFVIQQNGAQPCFLDEGAPPEDPDTPCSDEQQEQPAFNGRQSYYNSGFIPYEGPQGNEFRVDLAEDIAPGTYNYYCNLHGPFQRGTITVVGPDAEIPSATDVARAARAEIEAVAKPLRAAHVKASEGEAEVFGQTIPKPIAGFFEPEVGHAFISEFIPRRIEIDAGEAVTWAFVGMHTVSFDVPRYFSQMTVADDGTVSLSPEAIEPVNSPGAPEPPAGPPEEEAGEASPDGDGDAPPDPVVVDAGDWDGTGFISSGVFWQDAYRLRFTRAGTYPYACLIHPQMVGEVIVH